MRYPTRPPERLSDLIDLAITDVGRLDRTTYTPHPGHWHEPTDNGRCAICLAGSVIAGTLKCPQDKSAEVLYDHDDPDSDQVNIVDRKWQLALWALDDARQGLWADAYDILTIDDAPAPTEDILHGLDQIPVPERPEFEDWTDFDIHLKSLASCADELRKLGL